MTDYSWLPALLQEVAEVAGLDAALKLAETRGGTRVYIPRFPKADHWLPLAVGEEAAEKIAGYFATGQTGIEIEIPLGPSGSYKAGIRQRARAMQELLGRGASSDAIARSIRITRRSVNRFKARLKADDDDLQGQLF